jgi:4-amino-4-deoxy-L-arabinose transferase-like glycosyltransferase
MLVLLGWFLFYWTKKEFGNKVALLVLTLFSFSPTFLAHGRYVTTDVGATLGILLSLYFWLKFLKSPTKKNVILTGLVFGLSMLFKFSTILLIPLFAIITITYALLKKENVLKYLGLSLVIGLIGVIFVMMPVYQFHVLNYPPQKQLADTISLLESSPLKLFKNVCIWMADKPVFRTIGHYFLGLLMATQRTAFGNTVYFMDMVSASGWWYYFPVVYFLKVPLAFHILTLIALLSFSISIKEPFWIRFRKRVKDWILSHFTQFSMLIFLIIYWGTSISGRLNIGVRHVLPTFPFTYVLVSSGLIIALNKIKKPFLKKIGISLILILIAWYIASSISSYPYYLSHFNEIGGGIENGYQYVVDSNYDWGQDLKRLALWVKANDIEKIKVDYFGGGDIDYYLGDRAERFDPLSGPQKGWLAIAATPLQGGRGNPVPHFHQPTGFYNWLNKYQPVARAGKSIFIYHIE